MTTAALQDIALLTSYILYKNEMF